MASICCPSSFNFGRATRRAGFFLFKASVQSLGSNSFREERAEKENKKLTLVKDRVSK
jgi:hypothetical protein